MGNGPYDAEASVPSIFNGNFEWGTSHAAVGPEGFADRVPFGGEMPGWSFHGGNGLEIDAYNFDITRAFVYPGSNWELAENVAGAVLSFGWNKIEENVVAFCSSPADQLQDSAWQIAQEALQKACSSFANAVGDQLTPDLEETDWGLVLGAGGVISDFMSEINFTSYFPLVGDISDAVTSGLVDAAFDLNKITHNRLVVPEFAETLAFDVRTAGVVSPHAHLEVTMHAPSLQADPVVIGSISLTGSLPGELNRVVACVPPEYRGEVVTFSIEAKDLVESTIIGGEQREFEQIVFIDNVAFEHKRFQSLSVDESTVLENEDITIKGEFTPWSNPEQPTLAFIDWGDDSPIQMIVVDGGGSNFEVTHRYRDDDPTGTPKMNRDTGSAQRDFSR